MRIGSDIQILLYIELKRTWKLNRWSFVKKRGLWATTLTWITVCFSILFRCICYFYFKLWIRFYGSISGPRLIIGFNIFEPPLFEDHCIVTATQWHCSSSEKKTHFNHFTSLFLCQPIEPLSLFHRVSPWVTSLTCRIYNSRGCMHIIILNCCVVVFEKNISKHFHFVFFYIW